MTPSPRAATRVVAPTTSAAPVVEPAATPLVVPDDAGPGWLRAAMDSAAMEAATCRAAGPVLAVAVSKIALQRTPARGDVVRFQVDGVRYGSTSLTLALAVWCDGDPDRLTTAEYTFFAVDELGRPRPVLEPAGEACDDPATDSTAGDQPWMPPT